MNPTAHKHNCEACPDRDLCLLPSAFTVSRFISAENIPTEPALAGCLEGQHDTRVNLSGTFEEITTPDGPVFTFATDHGARLALLMPEDGSTPSVIDYNDLYDAINPADAPAPTTSLFGDPRPLCDRAGMLFSIPCDLPDGNRVVIAVKSRRDGLLLTDEYAFAVIGWQAWPEPLADLPGQGGDLYDSLAALFGNMRL